MGKIQVVCSDIATAAPAWRPQRTQPLPPRDRKTQLLDLFQPPWGLGGLELEELLTLSSAQRKGYLGAGPVGEVRDRTRATSTEVGVLWLPGDPRGKVEPRTLGQAMWSTGAPNLPMPGFDGQIESEPPG